MRDDLAVYFDLPPDNVRVITEYLGGGFGSKFGAGAEVDDRRRLARLAGAPVKLMLPRAGALATGNRPNSSQKVRLGAERRRQADRDRAGLSTAVAVSAAEREARGRYSAIYRCANIGSRNATSTLTPGRRRQCGRQDGRRDVRVGARDGRDWRASSRSTGWNFAAATVSTRCARPSSKSARKRFGWDEKTAAPKSVNRDPARRRASACRARGIALGV